MLRTVGIEIERRRISDVTSRVIGNDGNIVANFTLIWITLERIKQVANGHIGRPGNAGVGAIGIEQL